LKSLSLPGFAWDPRALEVVSEKRTLFSKGSVLELRLLSQSPVGVSRCGKTSRRTVRMRKSVGVIEPTNDMKLSIALLSLDIRKKRSHNAQTRDTNGKRNSSKDTKLSNKLRSTFVKPELVREPATRNPK
jgi:hypothetical protein